MVSVNNRNPFLTLKTRDYQLQNTDIHRLKIKIDLIKNR